MFRNMSMWTDRPILSFSLRRGFSNISAMTSVTSPFAIVRSASFSIASGRVRSLMPITTQLGL